MEAITTAPIRKSVTVPLPLEEAFSLFTDRLSSWWPLATHSIFGEKAMSCVFEAGVGGRIYELSDSGEEGSWGTVLEWEPPLRVVYSWNPNPDRTASTEIEVRFSAEGDGTKLELEHRSWENLGVEGTALREDYLSGWDPVLQDYATAAGS